MFADNFLSDSEKMSKYDAKDMSRDRIAAINFFTHETPFYGALNESLRSKSRSDIKPFFHWMKLALSGLYRLPLVPMTVYRGVRRDLRKQYPPGRKFVNWCFSSTTSSLAVLQSTQFLGKTGERTLFTIQALHLVKIKDFSSVEDEDELLLLPATTLIVKGVLDAGNGLTMIQIQEVEDAVPLLDFVHPGRTAKEKVNKGEAVAVGERELRARERDQISKITHSTMQRKKKRSSKTLARSPPASVTFTDREGDASTLRLNAEGGLS